MVFLPTPVIVGNIVLIHDSPSSSDFVRLITAKAVIQRNHTNIEFQSEFGAVLASFTVSKEGIEIGTA